MSKPRRNRRFSTRMGRSCQEWRSSAVAWLCLALVGFNLLAGTGLPVNAESALGERMVICSVGGMTIVDPGAAPEAPSSSHGDLCAFCLPLLHGGTQDTAMVAEAVRPAIPPVAVSLLRPLLHSARLEQGGAIGPRAPPAI